MVKGDHLRKCAVVVMACATLPLAYCFGGQIKKYVFNHNGFDAYSFEYETSDGSYRREDGGFITKPEGRSLVVRGEYGYIDPSGQVHSLKYVADNNGFQPILHDDQTRFNDRRII